MKWLISWRRSLTKEWQKCCVDHIMPEQQLHAGALFANLANHDPTSSLFYGQTVLDKQMRGKFWSMRHSPGCKQYKSQPRPLLTIRPPRDTTNQNMAWAHSRPLSLFLKSSNGILHSHLKRGLHERIEHCSIWGNWKNVLGWDSDTCSIYRYSLRLIIRSF